MGDRHESGIRHSLWRVDLPIFMAPTTYAPVPLQSQRRDNPGEMGGRVASPTLVGRVEELRILKAARSRAANGEPAVVLLGGEAGVGKTRLVTELAARCGADGTRVLSGGCVPVSAGGLPFTPIMEVLRVLLAELGPGGVRELAGPSWPELAWLLPALGKPQTAGPPSQAAQARLFEVLLGLPDRHLNHRCNPNVYIREIDGETYIYARRNIAAGEEISNDYCMNSRGDESWQCNCGAGECRRTIHSDFFQLPLAKQVEYLPLLMDWFIEENAEEIAALRAMLRASACRRT